jgi:hypothetical protein
MTGRGARQSRKRPTYLLRLRPEPDVDAPVRGLRSGGLPFHLGRLLLIDGLPAVEIAVAAEKMRLFFRFRFRDGDGTLLSFHKRLFQHIDLNYKTRPPAKSAHRMPSRITATEAEKLSGALATERAP